MRIRTAAVFAFAATLCIIGASPASADLGDAVKGWEKASAKIESAAFQDVNKTQAENGGVPVDPKCMDLYLLKGSKNVAYSYYSKNAGKAGCTLSDGVPYVLMLKDAKGWKSVGYGPLGAGPGSKCTYFLPVPEKVKASIKRTGICGN